MSDQQNAKDEKLPSFDFASSDFDHEIYNQIARAAALKQVRLVEQKFKANLSDYFSALDQGREEAYIFRGAPNGHHFDVDNGTVAGAYSWSAKVKLGRKTPISLSAEYFLIYGNLEGADSSYVKIFFEKIARFASYPYFRSVFASCTSNAGLMLPPLPTLSERID